MKNDTWIDAPQKGMAPILSFFLVLLIIIGLLIGMDFAYIAYLNQCGDEPLGECLSSQHTEELEIETVTATGSIEVQGYQVNITMNIPLDGGGVTGSFFGDCSGQITGEYAGGLQGKAFGSCNPFLVPIPAKASFTGSVNRELKTVPISGSGSAAGFSGSGSLTLQY
jgi:hypothetical protein